MESDNPFFATPPDEETMEIDGRKVVRQTSEEGVRPKITEEQRLYAKLMDSQVWGDVPVFQGQEDKFPATVMITAVSSRVFTADDAGEYRLSRTTLSLDEILTSHYNSGKYRLLAEPRYEFSAETGKWTAAVTYQVRKFKQIDSKAIADIEKGEDENEAENNAAEEQTPSE